MNSKNFIIQQEHKALVRRLRQDGHKVIHFFYFLGYYSVQSREEMRILADVSNSSDKGNGIGAWGRGSAGLSWLLVRFSSIAELNTAQRLRM